MTLPLVQKKPNAASVCPAGQVRSPALCYLVLSFYFLHLFLSDIQNDPSPSAKEAECSRLSSESLLQLSMSIER